jgi:photosystem II stability/assembly factor-like uncharacterized protein
MPELVAATGDGIARIVERGDAWHVALSLQGSGVQCLALDPLHSGTAFAGSQERGVWRTIDGGERWEQLRGPHDAIFSLAVSAADGSLYAGCEPSMLFRSSDGGETWRELAALRAIPSTPTWSFPPRPWTSHVRWIAPSPRDPARLLAGIELGGLMYSADSGETWADHRPGAQRDVHMLAWHPRVPDRAYEAGGGGAAWSRDGGWIWEPADAGRDLPYCWAVAMDPEDPDCWYISAAPGPREAHGGGNAQAGIYRWRGGGPWQALSGGLPRPLNSMPYALVAGTGGLYAGLADGRIYTSHDQGDTWRQLRLTGDRLSRIVALVYRD